MIKWVVCKNPILKGRLKSGLRYFLLSESQTITIFHCLSELAKSCVIL